MSLRASTVTAALEQAESLHADGHPRDAAPILRPLVDPYDPAMPCADRQILRAADLFARTALEDPKSLPYARFAERNARTLLGRHDPVTISATQTLIAACDRYDRTGEAITVCGSLIEAHNDQDEPADALTWRRRRVALLYADGQGGQALDEVRACARLGAQLPAEAGRHAAAHPAGIDTTITLAGCGDTADAVVLLAEQNPHLAASVADRISVPDAGRVELTATGLGQLNGHRLAEVPGAATAGGES
jgi:hypothetical protein